MISFLSKKTSAKKRLLALLLSLLVFPSPFSYAQQEQGAEGPAAEQTDTSTINYNNNLFDVTETGVFDAQGNPVDPNQLPVLQATPLSTETFSLSSLPASTPLSTPTDENFKQYQNELIQGWGNQADFAKNRLGEVKKDLGSQESRFEELEKLIEQTQEDLGPVREEILTLENQLNLYNSQIDQLKEKTRHVENLIAEKKVALKQLMLELKDINAEFEILKTVATDFIRLLYDQGSTLTDPQNKGTDGIKLLLGDGTVNEQMMDEVYLETMEETGRQVFHKLEKKLQEAQLKQTQITQEQAELDYLLKILNQETQNMQQIRVSKTDLLEQNQGKEEEYLKMLQAAEQEQKQLELELSNMQDVEGLLLEQINLLLKGLNDVGEAGSKEALLALSQIPNVTSGSGSNNQAPFQVDPSLLESLKNDFEGGGSRLGLHWPVKPNKITALFHDSSYVSTFGVDHYADDIRAAHGSDVYAAADGMVVKTKFNGKEYAYISIAHGPSSLPPEYNGSSNGVVSLYGHMSAIYVRPGQFVRRGEVIGLSGATPGTNGAGLRTTAAHMHFEVWDGGKKVDPLEYLILLGVDDDYLPAGYKSYERDRDYWPKSL